MTRGEAGEHQPQERVQLGVEGHGRTGTRVGRGAGTPDRGRCRVPTASRGRRRKLDTVRAHVMDTDAVRCPRRATDRPVGRSQRRGRRWPVPTPPNRVAAAANGSSTRRSTTFATRGYRETRRRRHRGRRRDLQGRDLLPLPDQGVDLPRADATTADKLVAQGRARGRAPRRSPSRGRRSRSTPCSPRSPATARWRGCCSSTRSAPGGCSRRRRTSSTSGSRTLIQGYLDEAVADGVVPADRHAGHEHRVVRGAQRGRRRAGCWRTSRAGSRTRTPRCARPCCGPSGCPRRGSARCRSARRLAVPGRPSRP